MLVLMTLLAIWCAYSINWIRQRRELISSKVVQPFELRMDLGAAPGAPALLFLFGEPGYLRLMSTVSEEEPEFERIRSLFPEAKITRGGNPFEDF
jgi:hypothetical protein